MVDTVFVFAAPLETVWKLSCFFNLFINRLTSSISLSFDLFDFNTIASEYFMICAILSWSSSIAVLMITGIWVNLSCVFILSNKSNPEMSGRFKSRIIQSKVCCSSISNASCPVNAWATSIPFSTSCSLTARLCNSWSSMISTVWKLYKIWPEFRIENAWSSWSFSIGFFKNPIAPSFMALSPLTSPADIIWIGICLVCRFAFKRFNIVHPSITGNITSRIIASGSCVTAMSSPTSPL